MSISPTPARLHVLLARDAPLGLILRRGPSRQVCTIGWNRTDDTFLLGQWIKGQIYQHRSDLSPDGRHFLYLAIGRQFPACHFSKPWLFGVKVTPMAAVDCLLTTRDFGSTVKTKRETM